MQIESSVALRIVKHASQSFPNFVSGPLLGVDVYGDVLKVTQSFPFPYYNEDGSPYKIRSNVRYQEDLINELKETKQSVQLLGFYQASVGGKFISDSVIESLATSQLQSSPNSIIIVHDPSKAKYGVLSLKAFRLTKEYLETFIADEFQAESLQKRGLSYANIFEEVPIQIHNNYLISLYLSQFSPEYFNNSDFLQSSTAKTESSLANLESLIESTEEYGNFYYQLNKKKTSQADANLQEWLPLGSKISYQAEDTEQQFLTQFLNTSTIKP